MILFVIGFFIEKSSIELSYLDVFLSKLWRIETSIYNMKFSTYVKCHSESSKCQQKYINWELWYIRLLSRGQCPPLDWLKKWGQFYIDNQASHLRLWLIPNSLNVRIQYFFIVLIDKLQLIFMQEPFALLSYLMMRIEKHPLFWEILFSFFLLSWEK